jgi:hypothetical protein
MTRLTRPNRPTRSLATARNFAFSFLLGVAPAIAQVDEIGLLRVDPGGKNTPLSLEVHAVATSGPDAIEDAAKIDPKVGKLEGKKVLRFAFGADVDGDGKDEVVLVTEKLNEKDRPLELKVHEMFPGTSGSGDLGKPIASLKLGALKLGGSYRVENLAAGDYDGDGTDELMVIRVPPLGDKWVEFYAFPSKVGATKVGKVKASDWTFVPRTDLVVALGAADRDADGRDEIALLLRDFGGVDRLVLHSTPSFPVGEAGPPLASDVAVNPADGAINVAMVPLARSGPIGFQLAFLRRASDDTHRLDVHDLPATVAGEIGAPLASQAGLDAGGADPVHSMLALRQHQEVPWTDFEGPLRAWYLAAWQTSTGEIVSQWIGPFQGFVGDGHPGMSFDLTYPDDAGVSIVANMTGWEVGDFALWQTTSQPQSFIAPADNGILIKKGDKLTVSHLAIHFGTITAGVTDRIEHVELDFGAPPLGQVTIPDDDEGTPDPLRASIFGYRYAK